MTKPKSVSNLESTSVSKKNSESKCNSGIDGKSKTNTELGLTKSVSKLNNNNLSVAVGTSKEQLVSKPNSVEAGKTNDTCLKHLDLLLIGYAFFTIFLVNFVYYACFIFCRYLGVMWHKRREI